MNEFAPDSKKGQRIELIPVSKADSTSSEVPISIEEVKPPAADDSYRPKDAEPQLMTAFKGHIVLNPGISPINYYASLIHTIVTFFNLTALTTLQPLILLDKNSFNVDPKEIGVVLAELILIQTLTKMAFAPLCGYLADNAGRKAVLFLGAALALFGYILVGFQTSVFPGYAISKLFAANGGNILAIIPFNADYIHDLSKGKATGITQGLASAGSFLGSLFVTIMLKLKFSIVQIHLGTGIILMGCVLIYSIGIKGGKYFLVRPGLENDQNAIDRASARLDEKFTVKIRKGMNALSRNGWLLIALVIQTLARADYYLVTIVFSLYIKSYDTTPDEVQKSNEMISVYQDMFFALGFFGNLLYGFLLDKVSTIKIIFPALFFATLGYFLVLFAHSKDSPTIPLLIVFAGFAMPGLFNAANYLGIKHFPRDLRGVLSGIMNMIGVIGYLFLSTVGGYLFDNHGRSSPFFLFLIMLLVCACVILFIYKWTVALETKRRNRMKKAPSNQE